MLMYEISCLIPTIMNTKPFQTLMYEVSGKESNYRHYITNFLDHWMDNGNTNYTPDGLAWLSQDAPLRSTGRTFNSILFIISWLGSRLPSWPSA